MYSNEHKYFVQYMLRKGTVSKNRALQFLAKINCDVSNEEQLKQFIATINEKITENNFKICMTNCEITGERLIVWLNTRNDEISKLQNTFTPIELEYFQVLLKEIVVSQERYLVFSICSNLSSTLTAPLSKTDSFKLLSKWIKSGYFVKKDGRVYLGVRTLNEYSSYFHEYCEDYFSTCSLCSEKVFFGCSCESCEHIFHKHCLHKFLQKKRFCPQCNEVWVQENLTDSLSEPLTSSQ